MKANRLRHILTLVSVAAIATAAAAADPLTLHVALPERIADAPRVDAVVTLENGSAAVLDLPGLDIGSLHFWVSQVADGGTGKCVINTTGTPLVAPSRVTLLPGHAIKVSTNVLINYPLGLAPGRYTVQAVYDAPAATTGGWHGSVLSDKMPLIVEERKTAEYREFLAICNDLQGWRASAARGDATVPSPMSRVLSFAYSHPRFDFTPAFVDVELLQHGGDLAIRAADFLMREYPNSEYAIRAQYQKKFLLQVESDRADGDAYLAWLRSEKARPENEEVNRDMTRLRIGTIERPEDFAKYEAFLELHPDSYFSAEARFNMIGAVERGVVPPGTTKEAARERFYRELIEHNPKSLRAKQALRNPEVAAMVHRTEQ